MELAYKGKPLNYIQEVRDPELGEVIRARYPRFKPSFSKTVGYTYYGNRCPKCDSLLELSGAFLAFVVFRIDITAFGSRKRLLFPLPPHEYYQEGHGGHESQRDEHR